MTLFYRLLFVLCLISANAFAYSGPKGLYVLGYPVNMPDVSLSNEQGLSEPIRATTSDLTVMVFWSQSCAPCLREMKALEKFYQKAQKDNINVMVISPKNSWKDAAEERKFLTKYGAPTLPFYDDTDNSLSLKLGIASTPYTVIMDKNAKKVATIKGETNWDSDKLYKMIKKLIKD